MEDKERDEEAFDLVLSSFQREAQSLLARQQRYFLGQIEDYLEHNSHMTFHRYLNLGRVKMTLTLHIETQPGYTEPTQSTAS